jgi:hypothetical protein
MNMKIIMFVKDCPGLPEGTMPGRAEKQKPQYTQSAAQLGLKLGNSQMYLLCFTTSM